MCYHVGDPSIGLFQSRFQVVLRCPTNGVTDQLVVAVASHHAHGSGHIVYFNRFFGYGRYQFSQTVDGDHAFRTQVQRDITIGRLDAMYAFDALVNVQE